MSKHCFSGREHLADFERSDEIWLVTRDDMKQTALRAARVRSGGVSSETRQPSWGREFLVDFERNDERYLETRGDRSEPEPCCFATGEAGSRALSIL